VPPTPTDGKFAWKSNEERVDLWPWTRFRRSPSGSLRTGPIDVDVEGQRTPTELVESTPSEPMPPFADEKFKDGFRPWLEG